jgi:hypothetical protein
MISDLNSILFILMEDFNKNEVLKRLIRIKNKKKYNKDNKI